MNYTKIIQEVEQSHNENCDHNVDAPRFKTFPFETAFAGQNEAIETIIAEDACVLCSHTGSGKSACMLTAAHELRVPTLIIEPRKFLQTQIAKAFNDFILFGKNEYHCFYAASAAQAPCAKRHTKNKQRYFYVRNQHTGQLDEKRYPCNGCKYLAAIRTAYTILKENGILIVNMGNFRRWLEKSEFVIIDEADEILRSVSSAIALEYVTMNDMDALALTKALDQEGKHIKIEIVELMDRDVMEAEDATRLSKLNNQLGKVLFFQDNIDIGYHYVKKSKNKVYVELQPQQNSVLVDRLFEGKKVLLVSATPSSFTGGKT
jgi:hypothetical protein